MNQLDLDYQNLLQDILNKGVKKSNRTGVDTLSVFGRQLRHSMSSGFPLLTTKKVYWKGIIVELLWFLKGDTNIKYLLDNDCNIWTGDAYKNYCKKYWNIGWLQHKIEYGNSFYNDDTDDYTFEEYNKEDFINKIKTNNDFTEEWGDMGPIYGKQWREWRKYEEYPDSDDGCYESDPIDQISKLINDIKTDPDSRRLIVNAWNVSEIDDMVLPPCHYALQCWTRELSLDERTNLYYASQKPGPGTSGISGLPGRLDDAIKYLESKNIPIRSLSLMFNIRSNDVPLGLPFNIASYGLLLEILARMVNMVPDELIVNIGDAHIYVNQIDGVKEQLTRTPYKLPNLVISNNVNFKESIDDMLNSCLIEDFQIENYTSHPVIKMPLSN